MTPQQLAKPGTEHAHQVALMCWSNMREQRGRWPFLKYLHAIPNGGDRAPAVASRLKAEGVKAGVSDLFLPVPLMNHDGVCTSCGFYLEMKKPGRENETRGGCSIEQAEWLNAMKQMNYRVAVCYGWEDAASTLAEYCKAVSAGALQV